MCTCSTITNSLFTLVNVMEQVYDEMEGGRGKYLLHIMMIEENFVLPGYPCYTCARVSQGVENLETCGQNPQGMGEM